MIAIDQKKQSWIGWLAVIPYVGLLVPYYIVLGSHPEQKCSAVRGSSGDRG
jgi:hypothetical protein